MLSALKADIKTSLFFIATIPATTSIFYLFSKVSIKKGLNFTSGLGSILLFVGQLLCSLCSRITVRDGFLFAKLFSSSSEKFEVILLVSLVIAFGVQAYSGKEKWANSFSYYVQSAIIFILRPFSYIMTAFGNKIKNVVLILSFGTLPICLWFFERELFHSLCSDIFVCCLVAIILCSLSYPMKVTPKNGSAFPPKFLFLL